MDILVLERKGLSQRQIARRLGISRNTVKKYVENQGYAERAHSEIHRKSLLDPFQGNIAAWLEEDMGYKATWIYDHLRPMGFPGSYEIVKRAVHDVKDERERIAYMRFETEPGCQSQVDFGEFQFERADGTIGKIYLFSMILGYSTFYAIATHQPWTPLRIFAVLVLIPSTILFLLARVQLGSNFSIRPKARNPVTKGIYARVGHPIYVFGVLIYAGIALYLKPILLIALAVWVPIQIVRARGF